MLRSLLSDSGPQSNVVFNQILDRSRKQSFSTLLAIFSFLFIIYYVFQMAPYNNYLYSDMGGFWGRALDRLNGKEFIESQFLAWPPWYHIILAHLFKALTFLGLSSLIKLETALTLNIILYSFSVYAFHRACVKCFQQAQGLALITCVLYAFGFPAWYFNAFLLSENFSTPLFLIAGCLIYCSGNWRSLVCAALLFALGSLARPSIAPYGLAFVIGFLVQYRFTLQFILRSAVFSVLFFSVVGLGMIEVSRISHGKVTGLSANGGLDFYIANSDIHKVNLNYLGWHNMIVVPAMSWRPEQGVLETTTPYYQQEYYYDLAWQTIRHNPDRLIKNVAHIKNLFFSDMLPTRYDAPGFEFFRKKWDTLKFIMFLFSGFFLWLWRDLPPQEKPFFAFMFSTIGITMLVSYLFTGEPRYTYSIIFIFYLTSIKAVHLIFNSWKTHLKLIPYLCIIYAGFWGMEKLIISVITVDNPKTIHAKFIESSNGHHEQNQMIDKLHFPYSRKPYLLSSDGKFNLNKKGEYFFKTTLTKKQSKSKINKIKLDINSAWPVRIWLNNDLVFDKNEMDFFVTQSKVIKVDIGTYDIVIAVDYQPTLGGFSINYNRVDEDLWVHRQFIGVNDGPFIFSQLEELNHEE